MHVDTYGWTGDAPESSNYINPAVIALAKKVGGMSVLDAGCGNGALAGALHASGFQVTGVDADEAGLAFARGRFPECTFAAADFAAEPKGQFDIVTSTEVVEHLYSPHQLAGYCFAALRPGGTLIISTPYHGYLKNLVLALTGKWSSHLSPNWHGGHIKFWDRTSLSTLLENAGFEVTGFKGVGRMPFLWKSMILTAHRPE